MDTRGSKDERKAEDNIEKDCRIGTGQGRVNERREMLPEVSE